MSQAGLAHQPARVTVYESSTGSNVPPASADRDPIAIRNVVEAAYRNHAAVILGFALRTTRDPELAADVTQEAFVRLFTGAQAGRCPDNISGWLHRTSSNLVISRARHETVVRRVALSLVRTDGPAQPDAIAVFREAHIELQTALAVLPVADQIALLMAARGATGAEIASHLGRSHAATRTLLSPTRQSSNTKHTSGWDRSISWPGDLESIARTSCTCCRRSGLRTLVDPPVGSPPMTAASTTAGEATIWGTLNSLRARSDCRLLPCPESVAKPTLARMDETAEARGRLRYA